MLAPIVLFAYKRPNELERTINALAQNYLAEHSELYIYVDGPKSQDDLKKVENVRNIVRNVRGFKDIYITISEKNIGCADSVIRGVSQVLEKYEKIIVLEDDIVTSKNFLNYMNQNLDTYNSNREVFSIGAYTFDLNFQQEYTADVYFIKRTCAWGWGIWKDRWEKVDWEVKDYNEFIQNKRKRSEFNYNGSDRVSMLTKTMNKKIDAWDIRLCYSQYKNGGVTVYPKISKVENIGFYTNDAVNTNVYNRYRSKIDNGDKVFFDLPEDVKVNKEIHKKFVKNFDILTRVKNRLKTLIGIR